MRNTFSADLILKNADVITCDANKPKAEAVAVKGDRILRIGNNEEAGQTESSNTRVIDCQGKTLIPGFIDAHCHFFSLVRKFSSLDLSPAKVQSITAIKESIRHKARFTPEGTWISGADYNEYYLADKRHPTRQDLDEAAPRHPVIITHRSLHASVLNSLALKMIGIFNETEEPPGGMIDRELETGEPNGILYEMQEYIRSRIESPITGTEMEWGIAEANRQYLSMGITSIGEATVTNDIEQWQAFQKLKREGKIKSRIFMMAGARFWRDFIKAGLVTGAGDNELKVGSLKIVLSEATGQMLPSQEELNRIVMEASKSGFQVAIHAVEKSTVEAAIIALELSQKRQGTSGMTPLPNGIPIDYVKRHRIEHCSECPPELTRRLKQIKTVIVSQPPFVYYHGERYLGQVPAEVQQWLYPFKSWIEGGLVVAGSSDSPVVPNNPLMGIYGAVTRKAESGDTLLPREKITARQALEMYTINAAFASGEEKIKGSLAMGKLADMVLLSRNPLEAPTEQIKEICAMMTVVGGEVCQEKESG
jgi:predicted amidohydrolase YtcJ